MVGMGRPTGSRNRPQQERDEKPSHNTSAALLAHIERLTGDPDKPFPFTLDKTKTLTPSKVFADEGRKVAIMAAVTRRAEVTTFPKTEAEVFDNLESMYVFCAEHYLCPTIGLFALWNGVSIPRLWQIENDSSHPCSRAVKVAKESIRQFIEQATVEGSFNPLLFFNMMKSQYGLAENVAVTVKHEDNATEITEEEYSERVVQLTEGADGVYRQQND